MQIANPPNWDLQNAQNGSNPDIYIGRLNNNLRDFFRSGMASALRVIRFGISDCGFRIVLIGDCLDFGF